MRLWTFKYRCHEGTADAERGALRRRMFTVGFGRKGYVHIEIVGYKRP